MSATGTDEDTGELEVETEGDPPQLVSVTDHSPDDSDITHIEYRFTRRPDEMFYSHRVDHRHGDVGSCQVTGGEDDHLPSRVESAVTDCDGVESVVSRGDSNGK